MAQVHSNPSITNMTYNPPPLPDYLSRNHTLSVIVGVPTDEEVQAIHDTIKAVNSRPTAPTLYDHKLSTQLAQYLFTIQMAVYRSEYPSSVFPGENTYTPPSAPSHIPISLEPVVGAPSDGELESAHGAVRTLEGLAHSPFFDAGLSAKLSQHLFNIQFARYIQDSNQGHFTQRPANPRSLRQTIGNEPPVVTSTSDPPSDLVDGQGPEDVPITQGSNTATNIHATSPNHVAPESIVTSQPNDKLDQICATLQETNRLLRGNDESLSAIRRTLVSTHYADKQTRNYGYYDSYATMNENGELPWMRGLVRLHPKDSNSFKSITVQELSEYLKFYDIGAGLIETGSGNINPDKEGDAKRVLTNYLNTGYPTVSRAG